MNDRIRRLRLLSNIFAVVQLLSLLLEIAIITVSVLSGPTPNLTIALLISSLCLAVSTVFEKFFRSRLSLKNIDKYLD